MQNRRELLILFNQPRRESAVSGVSTDECDLSRCDRMLYHWTSQRCLASGSEAVMANNTETVLWQNPWLVSGNKSHFISFVLHNSSLLQRKKIEVIKFKFEEGFFLFVWSFQFLCWKFLNVPS